MVWHTHKKQHYFPLSLTFAVSLKLVCCVFISLFLVSPVIYFFDLFFKVYFQNFVFFCFFWLLFLTSSYWGLVRHLSFKICCGLTCGLSWRMPYVHLRRMHIMLLLGDVLYISVRSSPLFP